MSATSVEELGVTVVVASCNDGPYVAAAVESALAQTAPQVDVLVIDDGSIDDGPAALAHVSDPRVRVVCQPRRGLARTLNLGLALARSPWVVLLQGRDTLRPDCVERQLAALHGEPRPVAVLVGAQPRDPSGAALASDEAAPTGETHLLRELLSGDAVGVAGALVDRGRVLRAGGFAPSLRHAVARDLWLRLLLRERVVVLAERLVDVTVRGAPSNANDELAARDAETAWVLRRALQGRALTELLARLLPEAQRTPAAEAEMHLDLARLVLRAAPSALLGTAAELAAQARALGAGLPDDADFAPLRRLHPGLAVPPEAATARAVHATSGEERRDAAGAPVAPLRVALEVGTLDRGGLETVVVQLARGLRDAGHVPLVVCTEGGGAGAEALRRDRVEVAVLQGPERAAALARLLTERRVQLVNAHFSTFASRIAAELGIPVVSTLHNAYAWLGSGVHDAIRAADRFVDGYVAVSESVADFCAQRFAIARERIVVLRNSSDAPSATRQEDRAAARHALGVADDVQLLLQVGRVDPIKCQLALVEAMRRLAPERPRLQAWIVGGVGNPAYAHRVGQRVREAGLEERVALLGERDDVPRLLAAADVFVLPSVLEGLSLAALEAMAAGVPAVLTRTGDADFLLGESDGAGDGVLPGAIVDGPAFAAHVDSADLNALAASEPPPHAEALAAALAEVLDDLPRRSERARRRAAELAAPLSRERWLAAHVELFTTVAAAGAARRSRALAAAARRARADAEAERRSAAALDATVDALSRVLLGNIASQRTAALLQRTTWDIEAARLGFVESSSFLGRALDKLRITHRIRTALQGLSRRFPDDPGS